MCQHGVVGGSPHRVTSNLALKVSFSQSNQFGFPGLNDKESSQTKLGPLAVIEISFARGKAEIR